MNNVRVAAIAPYPFLPYTSGGQKLIAQFYQFLSKHFDVKIIATAGNQVSLVEGYQLFPLLGKGVWRYINPLLYVQIKKFVREQKIDVLIAEHPYHAWLLWLLKKTTNIKIILHSHNIEHERFRSLGKWWWRLMQFCEGIAMKMADHCFFISDEDLQNAVAVFKIKESKCSVIPFGVLQQTIPEDKAAAKKNICEALNINESTKLILFSAPYNYQPNVEALQAIIDKINPLLQQLFQTKYLLLITGKNLPAHLNGLKDKPNVLYKGFVDDIDLYFKAADVLLNPLLAGGGVKTKVIEAISFNTSVVSTVSGAAGINKEVCGNKLLIADDNNWQQFADFIQSAAGNNTNTPAAFYDFYCLDNIMLKVAEAVKNLVE